MTLAFCGRRCQQSRDLNVVTRQGIQTMTKPHSEKVLSTLDRLLPELESVYKDIHAHPELSMQEVRTSKLAADQLRSAGYEVTTGVGKTGVVGLLRNGDGPTL